MAAPTAPALELLLTTPYRLRVLATGEFESEAVTDLTFEVSTVSDFATTLDSSEVAVQDYEFAIDEDYREDPLYVRVKATNDDGDSDWSDTLTVEAIARPLAPTLQHRGSSPQRIAAAATDLDPKAFRLTFQFSKSETFDTLAAEFAVESGPALAEYRVPAADRQTTHYVRAKVGFIADVDPASDDELFWDSDWSATLEVASAGKVADIDVESIAADKIDTGTMTANIVVSGRIVAGNDPAAGVGGYVDLNASGIEWVPAGATNPSVVLPSVGDASFTGISVTASKGLDATGVTLRGNGTVANDATIALSEGTVADPAAQPTIASAWPTEFSISSGSWTGAAYDSAGTAFWFARADGVRSYSTAGVSDKSFTFPAAGWTVTDYGDQSYNDAAYSAAEGKWVMVGSTGTTSNIWTSTDGTTWTSRTSGTTAALYAVARSEADDLWVAVGGSSSGVVLTSSDGITWTSRTSGAGLPFSDVARSETDDLWVAVGGYSTVPAGIRTSSDGITWTSRSSTPINGIARSEDEDLWVGVGDNGVILTSSNGTTWTSRTSGTTKLLQAVARSEAQDLWVAVGYTGTILTSPDGTTWTARTSKTTSSLNDVTYSASEGLWVVVGASGVVLTSPDGITWTSRTSNTTTQLNGIARLDSADLWLGLGSAGIILTSSDAGVGIGTLTGVAVGTGDSATSRGFAIGTGTLRRFNKTTGAKVQDENVSAYSSKAARASVFYDDSKIKVITQDAAGTGGKVQLVAYDPADLTATPTTTTLDATFTGNFSFYGAARFTVSAVDYYAIALSDTSGRSGIYCFKVSDGSRASTLDFFDSQGNVPDGGLAYNGTRFLTLATPAATAFQKHSTYHPGAATQNAYVRYSYASSSYETRLSPAANLALAARAYISVVTPTRPSIATKTRIYVRGASSDSTANSNTYLKISSGSETDAALTYGDANFTTGFDSNTTTIGPWAGSTGDAAVLKSAATGWELLGSGIVRLTEVSEPSAPAADKAVLFVRDNGSGKTQLCVRFSSGAVQVIATQP